MKKTLCLILALMLCIAVTFTGCNDDKDDAFGSVQDSSDVADSNDDEGIDKVHSDNKIVEVESIVEKNIGSQVELFIKGQYYLEGTIYSSGEKMPVKLSTDGKNYHYTTTTSGLSLSVLVLDGTAYLIEPTSGTYVELSDKLMQALGVGDEFDVSEITNFNAEDVDETVSKINQSSVTINGEKGICNEYVYDETSVKLYSMGDKLIQVDNYDKDGTLSMQIVIDNIVETIPSNQLTLKGLEKSSITSFISALANAAA